MAKEMREVLVCDVCGSEEEVSVVAVTVDGSEQRGELCGEHQQVLQEALAGVLPGLTSAPPQRPAQPAGVARGEAPARPARKRGAERQRAPKRRETCPHCGVEMSVQNLGRHIAARHPDAE
jgi:transcription elongation factor Elf1